MFICSGCNRKFAINSDPNQVPSHCRNCRNSVLSTDTTTIGTTEQQQSSSSSTPSTSSPVIKPAIAFASNPHKQLKPKGTRRGKFNQLICKLCGISFFYRRCLLRHLREQHAQAVDVNNLHGYDQYIEVASQSSQESCSDLQKEGIDVSVPSPQSPGLDMTGDSQLNSHSAEYALQDCDPSQFSYNDSDLSQADLSQSTAGDMSQGDLTDISHNQLHNVHVGGANISQADLSQSSAVIHQHVGLNLGSSSISATSIIEAVQTQAMLEQASALLSQNNITDQSGGVDGDTSSLLTQINSSVNDENPDKQQQAAMATGNKLDDNGPFREFKCTVCNKSFDRPYRLTRHLEIHDPNRPRIPCNYCSKSFTRKDSLESHIKTIHASVYPFSCSHDGCNRSFATRSMYLNHLKVHGDNKPYHCQECSESFGHLAELKDHFKKEHPENDSLRCVECFKVFSTLEELEEHKLHDHRFECENCGKVFARLAYLQNHVRVHNGESKFNCRFCSEGFNSAYSYRQHMKNHPEYRRIINVFPCHPCGKTFEEPKDLVTHYETEEHKEKASNVENAVGPSTATSMMEGDLSVMGELMTDQIINSIVNTHHSGFEEMSSSQS